MVYQDILGLWDIPVTRDCPKSSQTLVGKAGLTLYVVCHIYIMRRDP